MTDRTHYTYDFMVGSKIVHSGITIDPERRAAEHSRRWPNGRMVVIGNAKTEEGARAWEATKQKTITPQRK